MKFIDILNEKFYKGIKDSFRNYVEIFENPTSKEIKEVQKLDYTGGELRGAITDKKNPTIYIWSVKIIHNYMKKKIDFDFGFKYNNVMPELLFHDPSKYFKTKEFGELKFKEEVVNKIKKTFPKVKFLYMSYTKKKIKL